MLATNTSSLLVTAIAAAAEEPGAGGRHALLQPRPGDGAARGRGRRAVGPAALALARATGEAMGKHVIDATDGPGFLVNRCNRPFGLEALRLLAERVAPVEQIDRICRLGGGFRMGPFEVMDLVGVDVGLDVARSFYEQSFGEPRWRPSPITVRTVAAGRLGRKAGPGLLRLRRRPPPARRTPSAVPRGGGDGLIVIAGESTLALELGRARRGAPAGRSPTPERGRGRGARADRRLHAAARRATSRCRAPRRRSCCAAGSLAALDPGGSAVGFHLLPPLAERGCVELTRGTGHRAARPSTAADAVLRLARARTRSGSATPRGWCSAGSSASSSTRRRSPSPRASAAPTTSTPAWSTASTTRAASLAWADTIGLDSGAGDDRGAVRGATRGALPSRSAAQLAWCSSGRLGRRERRGFSPLPGLISPRQLATSVHAPGQRRQAASTRRSMSATMRVVRCALRACLPLARRGSLAAGAVGRCPATASARRLRRRQHPGRRAASAGRGRARRWCA